MDNNRISNVKPVFKVIKVFNFDIMSNEEIQKLKQNQMLYSSIRYHFGTCTYCGLKEEYCPGEHYVYVGREKRCRE